MTLLIEFETERLILRQWQTHDLPAFARLNADPRVMAYFPSVLSSAESDALATRCQSLIQQRGFGFWAAELKSSAQCIGMVGLHIPSAELPFSPCVEIGWRLAFDYWRQGLAYEAARAALAIGFDRLNLTEIVAFTTLGNLRSQALMQRLGMRESGTFAHPQLAEDSPLRAHYLYRLSGEAYHAAQAKA